MSLQDAITFITDEATDADLTRLTQAMKLRNSVLRAQRAALVNVGDTVRLIKISPKYLTGLTGTVVEVSPKRSRVVLDAASTRKLARTNQRRFFVASDSTDYELGGLPASTLEVIR